MDLIRKIKRIIVALVVLAVIIGILLLIFSAFILILPVAIVLIVLGILIGILRRQRVKAIIKQYPEKPKKDSSDKDVVDVEYKVKE